MKYKSFKYSKSGNIGDEVQTIATEQHLPTLDGHVDRDGLALLPEDEEPFTVIMNGWYSSNPRNCLPASKCVIPVFWGFHMNDVNGTIEHFTTGDALKYLKKHEPIGCRDRRTTEILAEAGVDAFYSKCVTLTFPKRDDPPQGGKIFIADARHIPVCNEVFEQGIETTQYEKDYIGFDIRKQKAARMLQMYREEASLVITTKIHCAMPCIAMGIPVIFFGNANEYRVSIMEDLGATIYPLPPKKMGLFYRAFRKGGIGKLIRSLFSKWMYKDINWNPEPLNVDEIQSEVREGLRRQIKMCLKRAEASKL